MTNEQIQKNEDGAMESAWRALKPELGPSNWTTGESFTYRGFFCWGWEARRQYDSDQIDALKAEVERLREAADRAENDKVRDAAWYAAVEISKFLDGEQAFLDVALEQLRAAFKQ